MIEVDELGAVFLPAVAQKITRPVFAYGAGRLQDPVFTCPVSAIPDVVWSLIDLWLTCRSMKALPHAGGVLDQPYIIRRAWPLLENAMRPLERREQADVQMQALAAMMSMRPRGIGAR